MKIIYLETYVHIFIPPSHGNIHGTPCDFAKNICGFFLDVVIS